MTTSQRMLRQLGGLGRQLLSSNCATLSALPSGEADLALLHALAGEGLTYKQARFCTSFTSELDLHAEPNLYIKGLWRDTRAMQQVAALPFAAQGASQPATLPLLAEHMVNRSCHPADFELWLEEPRVPPPQPLTNLTKYGGDEVWLTSRVVLTTMREVDSIIEPPSVAVPFRADSVRRKRKHKMNKHKHKKRRKLQRHKN